jgi:hypothetical protein
MLKWLKERWREMRGNALWDVAKLIAIPVGYALIQAIRKQPLQWAVLVICLIIGVLVVLMTRPWVPIKGRAGAGNGILSVADWEFEQRQTTPEGQAPIFKRKIRIVLRNETGQEIEVDTPDWAADAGDLAVQPSGHGPGAASKIRLEDKQSGGWKQDKWLQEANQLIVPPAHHFEAWVGLSHGYTDKTLKRYVREGRIGTLVFFVLVEGRKRELRIRVT